MEYAEQCPHAHTRLRKRAGIPGPIVQRQCVSCARGVGPTTPLDRFSKSQQRVLELWADDEPGFNFGPPLDAA